MKNEVTANEVARKLGVNGKTFSSWLRQLWRAGDQRLADHALHNRWVFTPSLAKELESEYRRQKF